MEIIGCRETLMLFKPKSKKLRVRVWRKSGKREVDDAFSSLIYGGKWDKETEKEKEIEILVKGENKPPSEVVVVMSQPCRGRSPLGRFSFISIFFNKLCLVARKGRNVINGVVDWFIGAEFNYIFSYFLCFWFLA